MYWTRQTIGMLNDAPWPMTKSELCDYVNRTTGNKDLLENISELDDAEEYESIEEICPLYDEILNPFKDYIDVEYFVLECCA